ncbi:MAG: heme exporter protein CcmB [Myxococcota bacterium]
MNVFWAILWKDLVTEWRSRDRAIAMAMFAMLVVVILQFALPGGARPQNQALAPALLWVTSVFAALLGLNRAFAMELENDALSALALVPADRGWVGLGKAAASFLILFVVQVLAATVFALFFNLDWRPVALPLAGIGALGALGLCSVGTLFGAMAVRTRYREVMLPLLLLPLLVPVISGAVRATSGLLESGSIPFEPLQLLLITDTAFVILSFLGFDYVLDE